MTKPEEILVRGPNWAGDLVMATPAFRALRAAWPAARITAVVKPGLAPLLSGAPWVDEVVSLDSHRRGPLALAREALGLRRLRGGFDLGVCLPDSFEAALHMRLSGVRRLVGYRTDLRRLLLDVAVEAPRAGGRRAWIPRERHVLGLVEAAGAAACGTDLELFTTEAERSRARSVLQTHGVGSEPRAVLAPGASYGPSKIWPAERFAEVGDRLVQAGARVVLVGTSQEAALTRRVADAMASPVADLAGELDLGTLKVVIEGARVLVCNDAGARHVAVAFGVPTIVMMGPTSLAKTNLNLDLVRVLTTDVDCRPCYLRECPIDHRCMTGIPAARVAEAALPALDDAHRRRWRGDGAPCRVPAPGGGAA